MEGVRLKMTLAVTDFAGKDGMLDVPRLMALSLEDFSAVLFEESSRYMRNHPGAVFCRECDRLILKPKDLVRYFGINLHSSCFVEVYDRDRGTSHVNDRAREYFDRVLEVVRAGRKKEFTF